MLTVRGGGVMRVANLGAEAADVPRQSGARVLGYPGHMSDDASAVVPSDGCAIWVA